jgi:DNA-binding IclR family transcriptional regulator
MASSIQSLKRAAEILRLLSGQRRQLGLAELTRQMALPKTTVHGLLHTLAEVGYVERDRESGKYRLGPALLHMGLVYLDADELRTRALLWANALAHDTRATVQIGRLYDHAVLVVHHVIGPDDGIQPPEAGALLPAHATALGKVLLATVPNPAQTLELGRLQRLTDRTVTNVEALLQELATVRSQGYAAERGELLAGRYAIAAPIADRHGNTIGAIGITGAVAQLFVGCGPRPDLITRIRDAGRAVSRELGATPW